MTPRDHVLRLLGLWAAGFVMRLAVAGSDPSTLLETHAALGLLTSDPMIPTSGSAWLLAFVARWTGGPITLEHVAWTASWLGPLLGGAVAPLAYLLCRRDSHTWAAICAGVLVFAVPLVSEAAPGRPIETAFAATGILAIAASIVAVHTDPSRLWRPLLFGGAAMAITLTSSSIVTLASIGPFAIAAAVGSARTARSLLRVCASGTVLATGIGVLVGNVNGSWSLLPAIVACLTLWYERAGRRLARGPDTETAGADSGLRLSYDLLALTGWTVSPGAGIAGLIVALGPRVAQLETRLPARGRRSLAWLGALALAGAVLTSGCLP